MKLSQSAVNNLWAYWMRVFGSIVCGISLSPQEDVRAAACKLDGYFVWNRGF